MPFIRSRPRFFAKIMAELLFWLDDTRILFNSNYPLWHPKWLVETFADFQLPQDIQEEYGFDLTPAIKRDIFGLNAARLYNIDVPSDLDKVLALRPPGDPVGPGPFPPEEESPRRE